MLSLTHRVLLYTQDALLHSVTPNLRAVTVMVNEENKKLSFFFYHDGLVSDTVADLWSCCVTEVISLIPEILDDLFTIDEKNIEVDISTPVSSSGRFVFLRKETILPVIPKDQSIVQISDLRLRLLLGIQEALLGKISPSLRMVSIGIDPTQFLWECYFAYDEFASEEDRALALAAIQETSPLLPGYTILPVIERVDGLQKTNLPKTPKMSHREAVYHRWEPVL